MSAKEIVNDFKENYAKVRKLLDEESKRDPENEPYLSKYKAREILWYMRDALTKLRESDTDMDFVKLSAMLGTVLLTIGVIDMETEDLTPCEKTLEEAETVLLDHATKPEVVMALVNVYNNQGILWSNRAEYEKSRMCLMKAKELYETFKCTMQMPMPVEQMFGLEDKIVDGNDFLLLEKAHTLTYYYLAQVFGSLKDCLKSAFYCHITLKRQLQYSDYDPIDWSLNCATLSQFFAEQNGYYQSRHHLAASSVVLDQHEATLQAIESEEEAFQAKMETFRHRSADVARCWAKYCLFLLTDSKLRLMKDSEDDIPPEAITDMSNLKLEDETDLGGDMRSLIFPDLDVSLYENKITDKFLLTYEDARVVFLSCLTWLNKAKEYYKLNTLASDYIELVQDCSQAYCHLAFFEDDDDRQAKMHKRRITMLEELIKEINPTYYLMYCRQIWYELGETYADILNIKLDKLKQDPGRPDPHALNKINVLCDKSIEHYEHFLESCKEKATGKLPNILDVDNIKPVISALVYCGRNSMKRITLDKRVQLTHVKKSYEAYKTVVDLCTRDKAAAKLMAEEFSLCQDMVAILPIKIKKMESELIA